MHLTGRLVGWLAGRVAALLLWPFTVWDDVQAARGGDPWETDQ